MYYSKTPYRGPTPPFPEKPEDLTPKRQASDAHSKTPATYEQISHSKAKYLAFNRNPKPKTCLESVAISTRKKQQ